MRCCMWWYNFLVLSTWTYDLLFQIKLALNNILEMIVKLILLLYNILEMILLEILEMLELV